MINFLKKIEEKKIIKNAYKKLKKIKTYEKEFNLLENSNLKNKFIEIKNKIEKEKKEILQKNLKQNNNKEFLKLKLTKLINNNIIELLTIIKIMYKRILNIELYDTQIIASLIMNDKNYIVEMKTGEGKTFVIGISAILNSLIDKTYIITTNEYLVKRDFNIMKPIFDFFDIPSGYVLENNNIDEKKEIYANNIIYLTSHQFGFDYLRNNIRYSNEEQFLDETIYWCVIIDEIDSVLIDEAITPLIISNPTNKNNNIYKTAKKITDELKKDEDFIITKEKNILFTEKGYKKIEELLNLDINNLYNEENLKFLHFIKQAITANYIMKKDIDYIIVDKNNQKRVVLVDPYNGRISKEKQFGNGLQQSIELKENIPLSKENETIAEITYQVLFNQFIKITGMSGTIKTEYDELLKIYNLIPIEIPTNKPIIREDKNIKLFRTKKDKYEYFKKLILEIHEKKQPILIGTPNIQESEKVSNILKELNIKHEVLNAKNHEKEAEIIAKAGKKGTITVATNMAGRGVDIKIDEEVKKLGGLYLISTNINENERLDNQLKGRSGRQGEPGTSEFLTSIDDILIQNFANKKELEDIQNLFHKHNATFLDNEKIQLFIKNTQKNIQKNNFEMRYSLYNFDNIIHIQRKQIYSIRNEILNTNFNIKKLIIKYIQDIVQFFLKESEKNSFNQFQEIKTFIKRNFNITLETSLLEEKKEKLEDFLNNLLFKYIEKKYFSLNYEKNTINKYLKLFLLETIDNLWQEHYENIKLLEEGIHLESLNNKIPIIEFQKKSFYLFQEFLFKIKLEFIKNLFNDKEFNIVEKIEEEKFIQLIENEIFQNENSKFLSNLNYKEIEKLFDNMINNSNDNSNLKLNKLINKNILNII